MDSELASVPRPMLFLLLVTAMSLPFFVLGALIFQCAARLGQERAERGNIGCCEPG
ncbi:hypothetical protein [Nocardia brasiliensis]|uniref:hypothetical protein n=1 Tax=Nocardia brasiliensis TaxID=37326 RepID=UPI00189460C8|nr:hypothetical protein [Nocardia brasiliensis]MBF6547174.1 hypothetical protein [Nocardia brasiliensis]